jgi:hypothetical protein
LSHTVGTFAMGHGHHQPTPDRHRELKRRSART